MGRDCYLRALLFAVLIAVGVAAQAGPMTLGPEFELTSKALLDGPEFQAGPNCPEKKAQMSYVAEITARCPQLHCTVTGKPGKWDTDYTVQFTDGWWFKVSYDPGVVEITAKPSDIADWDSRATFLDDAIFTTGKDIGLTPYADSSNHFNFGVNSAFDGDAELFLRFFVDYNNHPDLASGSLGYEDYDNSPPLAALQDSQRQALQDIVAGFYKGEFKTVQDIARAIQSRVYTASYNPSWGGREHYQAIGLKTVNRTDLTKQDAPEELRSVFAQSSVEQFTLVGRLIQGRIDYLKTLKTPIVYTGTTVTNFTASELKNRFFIYVEEAGMKYDDFKSLLPTTVKKANLSPFLSGKGTVTAQLKDLSNYTDLFAISPWVKARASALVASAQGSKDTDVQKMVAAMTALLNKDCETALLNPPSAAAPAPAALTPSPEPVASTDVLRSDL